MKKLFFLLILILAAALSISIIKTKPSLFTRKNIGSFEYVRAGEDLMGKGKYSQAARYFEMAHEASPENKDIRHYLVWAYSKYSSVLALEEKYDEAIEYLAKAYDVIQNAGTMQNLAIIYSKRALVKARNGQWAEAIEDLETARGVASDSGSASKNLGISLFNDGVNEHKSGNDRLAILCVNEALLAYEDSRIFEFLGDIYYKKRELNRTLFYWDKARALNAADNPALAEKLEKLNKEIGLAAREESLRFPHFELKFHKDLPVDAGLISQTLGKAYLDVGKDLGYYPPDKTVVFLYSQDDFRSIFKFPIIVRAFYDGNIRLPLPQNPLEKPALGSYLYHEYTHAVVSAKTNNNCPVWLSEGIAVREELRDKRPAIETIIPKLKDGSKLSIQSLDSAFKRDFGEVPDLQAYYLLAYTAVEYIIDKWGIAGLRAVLSRMASGQHAVNAIDDEFLISEKEFDKRWRDYVQKRYGISS